MRGLHHKFLDAFKLGMRGVRRHAEDDGLAGGEEGPGLLESLQRHLAVKVTPGADTVHGDVDIYTHLH